MSASRAAAVPTTPLSTPKRRAVTTESPGNWSHPRLAEITRRKNSTAFTDKHARTIAFNVLALVVVVAVKSSSWANRYSLRRSPSTREYIGWAYLTAQLIALTNIALALLPLLRSPDPVDDIALTAAQRQLLGLPPSSAPPTPGSVYNTPPRYSRTPSFSGSVGSAKSFASSPLSGKGSPVPAAAGSRRLSASPFSPGNNGAAASSPLFHKAMHGSRKASFGSPVSASRAAAAADLFADSPAVGTPSPANKRTSVALNSKWLYEKGRKASGAGWAH